MVWVELAARRRTRSVRERSNTTRCDSWEKIENGGGGFDPAPPSTNSYPTSDEWAWPGPGSRWRKRELSIRSSSTLEPH